MATFPKNHNGLYFDALIRTQKAESILSLIHATYHSKRAKGVTDVKADIAKRLQYSYGLFKDNVKGYDNGVGSYAGSEDQFASQYTLGHEMAIWKNSNLDLNELATKVAQNRITIRDYLDVVLLNYVQPIDGVCIHPLHAVLTYMQNNGVSKIPKDDIASALQATASGENINALFQILLSTNYFRSNPDKELMYVSKTPIATVISWCNLTYVGREGYEKAQMELNETAYNAYIINDPREQTAVSDVGMVGGEYPYELCKGGAQNRVVYGTPGCGKSFYVQNKLLPSFGVTKDNRVRTTFYQDYTNTDFVGQILPKVHSDKSVTYEFNPGPFALALKMALANPDVHVALVIEELNRGNAASIFGDIFQLLDRDSTGKSQYEITNVNLQDYLNNEFEGMYQFNCIVIPSNLLIVATMNTSDQNVFTLDTAFKRRWQFEKIKNVFLSDHEYKGYFVPGMNGITWEELVEAINEYIVSRPDELSSEDKQLGVYFIDRATLCETVSETQNAAKINKFAYKLFEYLWDDVAKFAHAEWFGTDVRTLDELIDKFAREGKAVFANGIL